VAGLISAGDLIRRTAEKACITPSDAKVIVEALTESVTMSLLQSGTAVLPGVGTLTCEWQGVTLRRHSISGGQMMAHSKPRFKFTPAPSLRWSASAIHDELFRDIPVGHLLPDGTVRGVKADLPPDWKFAIKTPARRMVYMWHRMGLGEHVTFGPGFEPVGPEQSEQEMREYMKVRSDKLRRARIKLAGQRASAAERRRLTEQLKAEKRAKAKRDRDAHFAAIQRN
jgi:nucleoid DNA-binding protein